MARHELLQLLADPMQTRLGERPKLVILLDGLNESSGETKGLLQEISELSQLCEIYLERGGPRGMVYYDDGLSCKNRLGGQCGSAISLCLLMITLLSLIGVYI